MCIKKLFISFQIEECSHYDVPRAPMPVHKIGTYDSPRPVGDWYVLFTSFQFQFVSCFNDDKKIKVDYRPHFGQLIGIFH